MGLAIRHLLRPWAVHRLLLRPQPRDRLDRPTHEDRAERRRSHPFGQRPLEVTGEDSLAVDVLHGVVLLWEGSVRAGRAGRRAGSPPPPASCASPGGCPEGAEDTVYRAAVLRGRPSALSSVRLTEAPGSSGSRRGHGCETYEAHRAARLQALGDRVHTGRNRSAECTSPNPMVGRDRSVFWPWRTKSFRAPWPSSSAPSTRSTFWASHMGSGQAEARIGRCWRCIPP